MAFAATAYYVQRERQVEFEGRLITAPNVGLCLMNVNPEQDDAALSQCLRSWRVDASLPLRFQEQVWRRIEQEETSREILLLAALQNLAGAFIRRRAWVASYLALALIAGLALGFHQAREETSSLTANLGQRYVQSLDPYLKMRH